MKRVHVIGICGIGMSATALLLKDRGVVISGSDAECYEPVKSLLTREKIPYTLGFSPENIPGDADAFLIGRNAKLSPKVNSEVRATLATGKKIYSFPELLGEMTRDRHTLVVAGSFGKSTTTALVAWILQHAGKNPGYFIGAAPRDLPRPSSFGHGIFVAEGDEYPSAHDDPRPKFMHLHPSDVLLTALIHDHVNVYPTIESYDKAFEDLVSLLPREGLLLACADEKRAAAFAAARGGNTLTYGLHGGDWRGDAVSIGERSTFTLMRKGKKIAKMETALLGLHNIENIVGAAAYAIEKGGVTPEEVQGAVAEFTGVRRRLDNIAPRSRVPVFEGFGSSYEKARSAIEAVRLHFPQRPLVVVFEPHTFGWRNRANLFWYDDVFKGASRVLVAPPETQGSKTHDQLSHEEILTRVRATGVDTRPFAGISALTEFVETLKRDEAVLVLTSGDLEGALPLFSEAFERKFSL